MPYVTHVYHEAPEPGTYAALWAADLIALADIARLSIAHRTMTYPVPEPERDAVVEGVFMRTQPAGITHRFVPQLWVPAWSGRRPFTVR